ncbi:unnamed protein product [Calypogeia fissa]
MGFLLITLYYFLAILVVTAAIPICFNKGPRYQHVAYPIGGHSGDMLLLALGDCILSTVASSRGSHSK